MNATAEIGETAGRVWNFLNTHGKSSVSAVEKAAKAPKRQVHMALGWLAREDKIELLEENRGLYVALKAD